MIGVAADFALLITFGIAFSGITFGLHNDFFPVMVMRRIAGMDAGRLAGIVGIQAGAFSGLLRFTLRCTDRRNGRACGLLCFPGRPDDGPDDQKDDQKDKDPQRCSLPF